MTASLILGGARSGKSRHAEALAAASGKEVVYVATAEARDVEMMERIARHRQERNAHWLTVEETRNLGGVIARWCSPERVVLVDCVTLWLSNLLFADGRIYPEVGRIETPPCFAEERAALLHALRQGQGDVILVSNEVGSGIVPGGAVSRWFADEAGRLNQELAALCDAVTLVVAGLPLVLKA
ncbi:MAG TPA: bifunctional adenosylcobinamide kinase/adenosylcobinamide-phosphate guanylyltransferase [Burkholderiaceae bacterium]